MAPIPFKLGAVFILALPMIGALIDAQMPQTTKSGIQKQTFNNEMGHKIKPDTKGQMSQKSSSKVKVVALTSNATAPQSIDLTQPSSRLGAEAKRMVNPLRMFMNRPRISPLYLINGTVCRFVNGQPVCTTLSTTGLNVGGASGGGGGGSGGSGGAAGRPAAGGGGAGAGGSGGAGGARPAGGGAGGGTGGTGGGGGSGAARPTTAGSQSSGSSVQFAANPPARVSSLMSDEQSDVYVERTDNSTETVTEEQRAAGGPAPRPVVVIGRRPLGIFRRPVQYQLVTNRQEDIAKG